MAALLLTASPVLAQYSDEPTGEGEGPGQSVDDVLNAVDGKSSRSGGGGGDGDTLWEVYGSQDLMDFWVEARKDGTRVSEHITGKGYGAGLRAVAESGPTFDGSIHWGTVQSASATEYVGYFNVGKNDYVSHGYYGTLALTGGYTAMMGDWAYPFRPWLEFGMGLNYVTVVYKLQNDFLVSPYDVQHYVDGLLISVHARAGAMLFDTVNLTAGFTLSESKDAGGSRTEQYKQNGYGKATLAYTQGYLAVGYVF
ncbi:MAG: hypothetical protein OEW12_07810 [Deltaproteobacteria bacterium]|nr:hypothetical protein [Deltaproteobacteria bacterium]